MRPLVALKVPAEMSALVPFVVVCGFIASEDERKELVRRVMVPCEEDARLVLQAASAQAPPEVVGWHSVSDRPVPAWAYAEDVSLFWYLVTRSSEPRQVVELPEAHPGEWDARDALDEVVHFVWPLVAVYQIRVGKEMPLVWPLADAGRMALEKMFLRRANVSPVEREMFRFVIHRAGIPGALDAHTSLLLSRSDPAKLACAPRLPRPISPAVYEVACWPMYLSLGGVVRREPTVTIPGTGPAAGAARRRLRDLGWRVVG